MTARNFQVLGPIFRVCIILTVAALAANATIIGNFATDGNGTTVTVSLTAFLFGPSPNLRVATSSLTYDSGSAVTAGMTGTFGNIGTTFPLNFFMTINGTPLDFTLLGVGPGDATDPHDCSAATTNGKSCSLLLPGGMISPVVLTFDNNGTDATLNVFGTVTDGQTTSNWTGHLGATLTATLDAITSPSGSPVPPTPANIFAYFTANPTGAIVTSHSDTFAVTPIPEPDTMITLAAGLGLTLISLIRRRR
ncbi:MAG TPA: hypothetical protein VMJ75_27800 [Candidatus Acidoferrales bacterium]|nr:hypothetical protein [Candidatus Acidoferrales bacterium]